MKVAMITGGGQGIGRCLAESFAERGYAVSIAERDQDAGRETVERITGRNGSARAWTVDVSAPEAVSAWVDATCRDVGVPDVLVNNAGFSRNRDFLELAVEDFDAVVSTNLRGTFLVTQAVARRLVTARRGGAVVNIASTRALMSEPGTEAYSASKGGILALTHAMAMSLGPHGIRVNTVSPGWIETRDWKVSSRATAPQHSERDRAQHPVGRVGRPADIAEACLYLASAGFVTGQNLIVDGGMTIKMIYEA